MNLNFFNSAFVQLFKASFFLCLLLSTPLHAKRVALVIGNDNYTVVNKLQKAGNDAKAMERELTKAGFKVQLYSDLNYRGMVKAIETFANGISGGDEVVVFYAGHGVQIKSGSYLLPIDIEATSESEVEKTAYEVLSLIDKINEAKPTFTLVMVDACRDNPLRAKGRSVGNSRGMSAIEPPKGQMVVYSASRGQQALDRMSEKDPNPNGVFTREFIARMNKPGLKIEDLLKDFQDSVETLAKTINHDQRPAVYNESRGDFYFYGPVTIQIAPNNSANQKEEKFWEDVKVAGNKEAYEAYLISYPDGQFANLAKANILKVTSIEPNKIAVLKQLPLSVDAKMREIFQLATEKNDAISQLKIAGDYRFGRYGLPLDEIEAEKFFRMASSQGNAHAQAELGNFYRYGRGGLQKSELEAEKLFKLSSAQGNAQGQHGLASLYAYGNTVPRDDIVALKLFRLAAGQGESNSLLNVGDFYEQGRGGMEKDEVQAEKWYRLAADKGHPEALVRLGGYYEAGRGGLKKEDKEAEKLYKLSAIKGYSRGQTALAKFYESGRGGLSINNAEAKRLYELAAAQGDIRAINRLNEINFAALYTISNWKPLPQSANSKAIEIFKLATEKNDVISQLKIANDYKDGRNSLPKDEVEAEKFYRLASLKGNSDAQQQLGWFYFSGRGGLSKNELEAEKLFKLSAAQGNAFGQNSLAFLYSSSATIPRNDMEALRLNRLAAAQGEFNAIYYLGIFYEQGRGGLKKDEVEAAKWYRLASEKGHSGALGQLGEYYEIGRGGLEKNGNEAIRLYRLAAEKGNLNAQNKIKSFPTQVSTSLEKLPTKVTYAADIQFESNSSLFTTAILEDLIIKAKSINLEVIVILAHARSDEIDPLKLSVARADAVKSLLVSSGIGPQRIHVEAKGASTIVKNVVEVEIIGTRKN